MFWEWLARTASLMRAVETWRDQQKLKQRGSGQGNSLVIRTNGQPGPSILESSMRLLGTQGCVHLCDFAMISTLSISSFPLLQLPLPNFSVCQCSALQPRSPCLVMKGLKVLRACKSICGCCYFSSRWQLLLLTFKLCVPQSPLKFQIA